MKCPICGKEGHDWRDCPSVSVNLRQVLDNYRAGRPVDTPLQSKPERPTFSRRQQLILAFAAGGLGLLAEGIVIARYFWG